MKSKVLLFARLARRQARRWQALLRWRRASFHGIPVLFANSFPKSGTHLLTQVLEGFTLVGPAVNAGLPAIVTYMGDSGQERSETEIMYDLQRLLPGDIAYGHAHALQAAVELLRKPGYATYFMLRDPRDVVVSHVHYITEMEPGHIHHQFYKEELHSFDERLMVSILGRPEIGIEFPDIRQRFLPYLGWIKCPAVQVLRFEEFVQDRQATVSRALDYAVERGFQLHRPRQEAVQILLDHLDPKRSPTFRSGKAGGWREAFTPEHTRVFKEIAGDLLIQLGYERDLLW